MLINALETCGQLELFQFQITPTNLFSEVLAQRPGFHRSTFVASRVLAVCKPREAACVSHVPVVFIVVIVVIIIDGGGTPPPLPEVTLLQILKNKKILTPPPHTHAHRKQNLLARSRRSEADKRPCRQPVLCISSLTRVCLHFSADYFDEFDTSKKVRNLPCMFPPFLAILHRYRSSLSGQPGIFCNLSGKGRPKQITFSCSIQHSS